MKYVPLFIFIFFLSNSIAQNITSRITIQTGNYVEFFFNHLDDYSNGITLTDYTRLQIYYNDTTDLGNPTGPGWKLSVKAMDASIQSMYSSNTLDLNVVEVRSGGTTIILSNTYQELASGPENNDYTTDVIISYDVGKSNAINVVSNERYNVELMFLLETNY